MGMGISVLEDSVQRSPPQQVHLPRRDRILSCVSYFVSSVFSGGVDVLLTRSQSAELSCVSSTFQSGEKDGFERRALVVSIGRLVVFNVLTNFERLVRL